MGSDKGLGCGNFFPWEITLADAESFPKKRDKFCRYAAIQKCVEENKGRYSVDAMKKLLTSHDDDPEKFRSICSNVTNFSMIAAPTIGKLLIGHRFPCINGYKEYSI